MQVLNLICDKCGNGDSIPVEQLFGYAEGKNYKYKCPYGCADSKLILESVEEYSNTNYLNELGEKNTSKR